VFFSETTAFKSPSSVLNKRDLASDCSVSFDICTFIWAISASIFSAPSFKLSTSQTESSASCLRFFNAFSLASKASLILSNFAFASWEAAFKLSSCVINKCELASDCSASFDICTFIRASSTSIFAEAFLKLFNSRLASSASSPLLFSAFRLSSKAAFIFSAFALASMAALNLACDMLFNAFWLSSKATPIFSHFVFTSLATCNLACASDRQASRSESALQALSSLSRICSRACCSSAFFSETRASKPPSCFLKE